MSRAKRSYTPKAKGCYECSQRRINCDRGEPSCDKCVLKGIECSGISGQRQRFRTWVSPEKKEQGKPNRANRPLHRRANFIASPGAENPRSRIVDTRENRGSYPAHHPCANLAPELGWDCLSNELDYNSFIGPEFSLAEYSTSSLINYSLDDVAPWQRFLLNHFSTHIAPEMVIIDDGTNGWRHLVLPLACADELVLYSVLTVAAFHFSEGVESQHIADPIKLYSRTINELQKRRDLCESDLDARYRIIITIVVLLLSTIVNGSSDFAILFRMLQSALDVVGGEETLAIGQNAIASFSAKQIRKMRVYISPFISQDEGVNAVAAQAQQCWDDQEYLFQSYPDYAYTLPLTSSLRELAFQIYLQQTSGVQETDVPLSDLVSRFRLMLESIPEDIEAEHVLVWPVFIAASASHVEEHNVYFTQFLERQFSRSGFANVIKALESLRRIWARNGQEDWTTLLSQQEVFVM
ncbi:fungal-specific transcription factor domain-containing protein [Annulohypoxylon moriforme]|nr:fungal-specific transcription factor domain-containing protein [Annulohypoxylon moriforme]